MTTYNTGNPLGSVAPKDLFDNSENFDLALNGLVPEWTDRFGRPRKSYALIETSIEAVKENADAQILAVKQNADTQIASTTRNANSQISLVTANAERQIELTSQSAAALIASLGYMPPEPYTAGMQMTVPNQTVSYQGATYAPIWSELPFTTSGAFESGKFRLIQGVSSADLSADFGSGLVGYKDVSPGAVATTVRDKLIRIGVDVLDYGAIPNSTGPANTLAFQRAHDAVYARGGGTVFVPAGVYYVQGVTFRSSVRWIGAGSNATFVRVRPSPAAGVGIFQAFDSEPDVLFGLSFEHMRIIGDGTYSGYRPNMDATVDGIDFGTNTADAWIQQCLFNDLFVERCDAGLNLFNHVRNAPITNSRFWYNNKALHVENEHPYLNGLDIRYNDIGITGTIQDMEAFGVRLVSNRIGSTASISRSSLSGCAAWQNIEYGFRNILEHNRFVGCQFRGAGSFWTSLHGIPNDSRVLEVFSRGNVVNASNFWGGNGSAFVEFASSNTQSGMKFTDNNVVLDTGHFAEKKGSGAYTHVAFADNHFEILSVGDGDGAMVVRVPDSTGGSWNNFIFVENTIRNNGTVQLHDFIDIRASGSGHTIFGNNSHVTGGVSKGYYLQNTANTIFMGNSFTAGSGGSYSSKLAMGAIQAGLVIKDNPGFATENHGTGNIGVGSNFVDVPHGLAIKPLASSIVLTPNSNLKAAGVDSYWLDFSNITDTHMRIRVNSNPTVPVNIAWNVSAARFI